MQGFWDGFEKRAGSKPMGPWKRRFGKPRSDKEREERHGSGMIPPRGTGRRK